MAETFNYTREWTDEKAFPLLGFSRDWNNPEDYPTVETDERKVREDMQSLHDEVKNYLNGTLIPAVIAEEALVEDWEHAEALRAEAEAARVEAEAERASAEGVRAEAEQLRVEAESVRIDAEQARVTAESARVISEQGRSDAENVRVEAEAARVTAEAERAHEATGYVSRARVSANNAKVYAEGGNLIEIVETELGPMLSTSTKFTKGAMQYSEASAAAANGGEYADGSFIISETGALRYAAKAQAYAEGGTYEEYDTRQSFGSSTLNSFTVSKGAKQYAEEAKESASDAFSYKTSARYDSQEASRFAGSARTSASNAQTYATSAKNANSSAESAKTAAESAKTAAESAKTAAEAAQVAAEKARDEAQAAAGGGSGLANIVDGEGAGAVKSASATAASGKNSFAVGTQTQALGEDSFAEGCLTVAHNYQHVEGMRNIEDPDEVYMHIAGNGTRNAASNAHTLDWDGNAWFSGDVHVGSTSGKNKDGGSKKLATEEYVDEAVANAGGGSSLPAHTSADNGKFLRVVDGSPAWATVQNIEEVEF